jgi:hypothetical protein
VVMVLDPNAVTSPKSLDDLAQPLIRRVQNNDVPYYRSGEVSLLAYRALYALAGEHAKSDWVSPEDVSLKTTTGLLKRECVGSLKGMGQQNPADSR